MAVGATRNVGRMDGAKQIGTLFFYLALALAMTYPLAAHFTDGVLGPPGDNFEYLYKLWWFKHALFDLGVSPFYNAQVFYPEGYHLALHEMSLANMWLGMPLTILWGEVVSYNALVLLSFVLSGFGAYLVAFRLTRQRVAALLSGVVFAFCAYRMAHLGAGHLNLLGTQWLPFLFLCLEQVLGAKRVSAAVLAGVFFGLSALSSWYYVPMVAIAAGVYLSWRGRPWRERLRDRSLWQGVFVALIVAGFLMAPSLVQTAQQWSQREMAFSLREVDIFSASVGDFVVPNPMHPLWGKPLAPYYLERQDVPEYIVSLSWVAMVLGVAALWPRLAHDKFRNLLAGDRSRPGRKRTRSAYALLLGLSLVLALGTTLHIDGQRVYIRVPAWIERSFTAVMGLLANRLALHPMPSYYDLRLADAIYAPLPTLVCYLYLPFFDAMRVWTRFGVISAFALAILAGIGLARVMRGVAMHEDCAVPPHPESCPNGGSVGRGWAMGIARRRQWSALIGSVCLAAVVFELVAVPYPLGWSEVRSQPVDRWLAQQSDGGAVIQLPLWKAESGPGLHATTVHGKPLGYGYGAFFPRSYRQARPVLWDFPTAQALALLREWDVRYVLVGAESYGAQWPELKRRITQFDALNLVASFVEEPLYHSGWLAESLPDFGRAFIADHVYVYELR